MTTQGRFGGVLVGNAVLTVCTRHPGGRGFPRTPQAVILHTMGHNTGDLAKEPPEQQWPRITPVSSQPSGWHSEDD